VVLKPAGFRRFPASLWVITGILSAWLEIPVAANSDHAPAAAATSTRCLTWPDRTRPARFRDHPVPVITEDPRVIGRCIKSENACWSSGVVPSGFSLMAAMAWGVASVMVAKIVTWPMWCR
jgi:hypothetical protein